MVPVIGKVAYLSYPMTGQPEFGIPRATRIAASLRKSYPSWTFEVPHEFKHNGGTAHAVPGWTHADYIRADLAEVERRQCTAIALVSGWPFSKGCMEEFLWFRDRDLRIFSVLEYSGWGIKLVGMDGKR
jgi:hypothetical protein